MRSWIVLTLVLALAGCAGTSKSKLTFTQAELVKVPEVAYPNLFRVDPPSKNTREYVLVRAKGEAGKLKVVEYISSDHIKVRTPKGQESEISMRQVIRLERIREFRYHSSAKEESSGAAAAELAIYAPLIPVGLVIGPYFASIDEAEKKAGVVYTGLTKKQLIDTLGQPLERHWCRNEEGYESELWIYPPGKVLKGGQVMHLMNKGGKDFVYHVNMKNYWKDDPHCRRIEP